MRARSPGVLLVVYRKKQDCTSPQSQMKNLVMKLASLNSSFTLPDALSATLTLEMLNLSNRRHNYGNGSSDDIRTYSKSLEDGKAHNLYCSYTCGIKQLAGMLPPAKALGHQ